MLKLTLMEGSSQVGTSWDCQRGGDYGQDGPEIGVRNTQLGTGSSPDCRRGHGPWSHQGFIAKARLAVKGFRTDYSWFEPVLSLLPLRPAHTRPLAAESCPCLSLSRWPPPAPDLFMSNCRSISLSAECSYKLCLLFPPT